MRVPVYTLRKGAKGQVVRALQHKLGLKPDGTFGKDTDHAVRDMQQQAGLAVDGVVGPDTLKLLGIPVPEFWIDVSHYQLTIDWGKVAAAGVKGVVVKATNGESDDSRFTENFDGAKAAGLTVAAYAYAKPDPRPNDARHEATNIWHDVMSLGHIPLVLDLEEKNGLKGTELAHWAATWIDQIVLSSGRYPTVYANADFILSVYMRGSAADKAVFAKCPLWLAQLTADNDPSLPDNDIWSEATMLQFSWEGTVPGVPTKVDINWRFA